MAILILVALGYTRFRPKSYGDEVWDAESESL